MHIWYYLVEYRHYQNKLDRLKTFGRSNFRSLEYNKMWILTFMLYDYPFTTDLVLDESGL